MIIITGIVMDSIISAAVTSMFFRFETRAHQIMAPRSFALLRREYTMVLVSFWPWSHLGASCTVPKLTFPLPGKLSSRGMKTFSCVIDESGTRP